jgi:ribosomal protein L29
MGQLKNDIKLTKEALKDCKKQLRYLRQDLWVLRFQILKRQLTKLIRKNKEA